MTIWLCDRCGRQVEKDSYGTGQFGITRKCRDENGQLYFRNLKFCGQCTMELEKFLDDEFSKMPERAEVIINRRA